MYQAPSFANNLINNLTVQNSVGEGRRKLLSVLVEINLIVIQSTSKFCGKIGKMISNWENQCEMNVVVYISY